MEPKWISNQYDERCLNKYEGDEEHVVIPEGFTQIMRDAFAEISTLKEVVLPSTMETVMESAFRDCKELKKVVFNKDNQYIDWKAFKGCENLETIIFPADCEQYETINGMVVDIDRKKIEMVPEGISGSVAIPDGIEEIGVGAFRGCNKISEVVFPDSLRVIWAAAFEDCDSLEEVTIPAGVEKIDSAAFSKSGGMFRKNKPITLKRISIPTDLETIWISDSAFYFDDNTKVLVYPELPVTYMRDKEYKQRLSFGFCLNPDAYHGEYYDLYFKYVRSQRKNLINAAKKQGVEGVEEFFEEIEKNPVKKTAKKAKKKPSQTKGKKSVAEYKKEWTYGDGGYDKSVTKTKTIRGIMLKHYKGENKDVEVPNRIGTKPVVGIAAGAFADNTTITSVTIPESVFGVQDAAFNGCVNLKKVVIKGADIWIGSRAFAGCANLEVFEIHANRIRADIHPFLNCKKMMDENGLVIIGGDDYRVLCDCRLPITLEKIVIPEGVRKIDGHCFSDAFFLEFEESPNSILREVICPKSLEEIGEGAFNKCRNLQRVDLPEGLARIEQLAFSDCEKLEDVHLSSSVVSFGGSVFYGCKKLIVYVCEGSEAEKYAKDNNISTRYVE